MGYFKKKKKGASEPTTATPSLPLATNAHGYESAPWTRQREEGAKAQETTEKPKKATPSGCWGRFRAELGHPAFSAEEVSGHVLHGPRTFGPSGGLVIAGKTVLMGWAISLLAMDMLKQDFQTLYFAYLTNATLLLSCLYLSLSWFLTVLDTAMPSVHASVGITTLHKITWALYAVSAPAQIVLATAYWGMEWDGSLNPVMDYRNLMIHGGVLFILLLEGQAINRVPLRLRHFGVFFAYMLAYLTWTIVHAFMLQWGDPNSEDDDAIYNLLHWTTDPTQTAEQAAIFLLVLAPLSFMMVYGMSLPCCAYNNRRYLNGSESAGSGDDETVTSYVEMGNVHQYASGPQDPPTGAGADV